MPIDMIGAFAGGFEDGKLAVDIQQLVRLLQSCTDGEFTIDAKQLMALSESCAAELPIELQKLCAKAIEGGDGNLSVGMDQLSLIAASCKGGKLPVDMQQLAEMASSCADQLPAELQPLVALAVSCKDGKAPDMQQLAALASSSAAAAGMPAGAQLILAQLQSIVQEGLKAIKAHEGSNIGEFVSSVFPTSAFDSIEIEPLAINTDAAPLVLLVQVLLRRLLSSQHEAIEELGNRVVNEAATGLDDISVYLDQVNPTPKDVTIDVPPAMGESAHSIEMGCVKYVSTI